MEELIEILKKFEEERKKKIVDGKWININKSKEEAVADCFYPCAKEILCNGYFLVNNKYIIDLGAIELYYHEENGAIKDYAMYHIPERYQSPKIEGVVKIEKTLPYFEFGSLNLHQSGVDVTFEKENEYRASFLIRAYRVLELSKDGKYPENNYTKYDVHSTHIFDDMFYKGYPTKIAWVNYIKKGVTIDQNRDYRKNLKKKDLIEGSINTFEETDQRKWQFKIKGLEVNNAK